MFNYYKVVIVKKLLWLLLLSSLALAFQTITIVGDTSDFNINATLDSIYFNECYSTINYSPQVLRLNSADNVSYEGLLISLIDMNSDGFKLGILETSSGQSDEVFISYNTLTQVSVFGKDINFFGIPGDNNVLLLYGKVYVCTIDNSNNTIMTRYITAPLSWGSNTAYFLFIHSKYDVNTITFTVKGHIELYWGKDSLGTQKIEVEPSDMLYVKIVGINDGNLELKDVSLTLCFDGTCDTIPFSSTLLSFQVQEYWSKRELDLDVNYSLFGSVVQSESFEIASLKKPDLHVYVLRKDFNFDENVIVDVNFENPQDYELRGKIRVVLDGVTKEQDANLLPGITTFTFNFGKKEPGEYQVKVSFEDVNSLTESLRVRGVLDIVSVNVKWGVESLGTSTVYVVPLDTLLVNVSIVPELNTYVCASLAGMEECTAGHDVNFLFSVRELERDRDYDLRVKVKYRDREETTVYRNAVSTRAFEAELEPKKGRAWERMEVKLSIRNLLSRAQRVNISIDTGINYEIASTSVTLSPGTLVQVPIFLEAPEGNFQLKLVISSEYGNQQEIVEYYEFQAYRGIEIEARDVNSSLKSFYYTFKIRNLDDVNRGVDVLVSSNLKVEPETQTLELGAKEEKVVSVKIEAEREGEYELVIFASSGRFTDTAQIKVNVYEKEEVIETEISLPERIVIGKEKKVLEFEVPDGLRLDYYSDLPITVTREDGLVKLEIDATGRRAGTYYLELLLLRRDRIVQRAISQVVVKGEPRVECRAEATEQGMRITFLNLGDGDASIYVAWEEGGEVRTKNVFVPAFSSRTLDVGAREAIVSGDASAELRVELEKAPKVTGMVTLVPFNETIALLIADIILLSYIFYLERERLRKLLKRVRGKKK